MNLRPAEPERLYKKQEHLLFFTRSSPEATTFAAKKVYKEQEVAFTEIEDVLSFSCTVASGPFQYRDLNNLAVSYMFQGDSLSAEKNFWGALQIAGTDPVPYWNLIHVYYQMQVYAGVRKVVRRYLQVSQADPGKISYFLGYFRKEGREQERVLVMDVLRQYPIFSRQALLEIGDFFYKNRDYQRASLYYDDVLSLDAFDAKALYSMQKIAFELSKWHDVVMFGANLLKLEDTPGDCYFMLAKSYYELGQYTKAKEVLQASPAKQRKDIWFLSLWKDILLSENIHADLQSLQVHVKTLDKNQKTEWRVLQDKYRREMVENIFSGN
ncbi:MAG: tetratricopeptide repeat protein [Spirochaetota bacterium]